MRDAAARPARRGRKTLGLPRRAKTIAGRARKTGGRPRRSIEVTAAGLRMPPWRTRLARFILRALREAGYEEWDVSVLLCGDERMADLNGRYRGRKGPTDVLSFPREETVRPGRVEGDLAISLPTLRRNASAYGCTPDEELKRLAVHGLLHLAGMDHGSGRTGPMFSLQEQLLEALRNEHIIGERKK